MTLPTSGKALIFKDETEQNAFFDFWFHEYRVNGKSLAESVEPVAAGLTPLEAEVLEAHRQSRTCFLHADAVMPAEHQILLQDLLEPDRPKIVLTDLGLSASAHRFNARLALFSRLLTVRGITMTSGFSFGFNPERVPGILQAHRQKMKKAPPAEASATRFVFFFQKYRQLGVEQQYQTVV